MMEWSVTVAAGAFVILSAFMIAVLMNVRRLMKQLQDTALQMEERAHLLTVDAVQLLQRTDHTVLLMQEHLRKSASFMESMEAAGTVIRSKAQQVDNISSAITQSVMQHVQHAHEENQQRMSPLFRSLDAGLTLWSAWQRFSKASGEPTQGEKE